MPIDEAIYPTVRQKIMDVLYARLGPTDQGGIMPGVIAIVGNGDSDDEGRLSKLGDGTGKGVVVTVVEFDDMAIDGPDRTNSLEEFEFEVVIVQLLDEQVAEALNLDLRELAQYRHALVVNAATALITDGNGQVIEHRSKWNNLALDTTVTGGGGLLYQKMDNGLDVLSVTTGLRIRYRHAYGRPGVVA